MQATVQSAVTIVVATREVFFESRLLIDACSPGCVILRLQTKLGKRRAECMMFW